MIMVIISKGRNTKKNNNKDSDQVRGDRGAKTTINDGNDLKFF